MGRWPHPLTLCSDHIREMRHAISMDYCIDDGQIVSISGKAMLSEKRCVLYGLMGSPEVSSSGGDFNEIHFEIVTS